MILQANGKQSSLFQFDTPSMPEFDLSRCYTKPINYETAGRIVLDYHYAHRVPSIVVSIGMYVDDILAGVITYGIPPVPNVQRLCGEEYRKNTLELNRLFIFDWAGRNSESWLIGQSFKWLREQYKQYFILVSYADNGHGHYGYVYQATNWIYTGRSGERRVGYKINGHEYHNKALVNMIGSHAPDNVFKHFPNAVPLDGGAKERYVYFLGPKRQRKKMMSLLKWEILPYPKEAQP